MLLRRYQKEALVAIGESHEKHRSTLLVMATGLGKTVVFSEYARIFPGRTLVLAHRTELVEQAYKSMRKMGMDVNMKRCG